MEYDIFEINTIVRANAKPVEHKTRAHNTRANTRFVDISDWSHSVKGYDNDTFKHYPVKYMVVQKQEQAKEMKRQALLHQKNEDKVYVSKKKNEQKKLVFVF